MASAEAVDLLAGSYSGRSAYTKLILELVTSGTSVCIATTCTNPVDVVKTRMQLASAHGGRIGLLSTGQSMVVSEGVVSLWKGITPAALRGLTYGGLRFGLYSPFKAALGVQEGDKGSLHKKVAAGCLSGGLSAAISNPTELVKTRLQAHGCSHSSSMAVVRDVMAREGVVGLWRGTVPSAARAALLTASQCASYDVVKRAVMTTTGSGDAPLTHVAAGAITGVITTTVTSPADVIKTRMFAGGTGSAAQGVVATATRMAAEEGVGVFFRGWWANYARLGPQTLITFVAAEQLRQLLGLTAL